MRSLEELLALGGEQGFLTHKQVTECLPAEAEPEEMDQILDFLALHEIPIADQCATDLPWYAEHALGDSLEDARRRIRHFIFQIGMAPEWHLERAYEILQDDTLLSEYVVPDNLNDEEASKYLDDLGTLVEETRKQDEICANRWTVGRNDSFGYREQQRKLESLLLNFRFELRWYEQLAREQEKPALGHAIQLLRDSKQDAEQHRSMELELRLSLREYVQLEKSIAEELLRLDDLKAQLVASHSEFAKKLIHADYGTDPDVIYHAMYGLRMAANRFDFRRGYRFAVYAQHWIEAAAKKGLDPF